MNKFAMNEIRFVCVWVRICIFSIIQSYISTSHINKQLEIIIIHLGTQ